MKPRKSIYSFADLEVIETIKGEKLQKITVRQLGGQIGNWGMFISGTPYLQEGDEAIFFLVRNGDFFEIHSIALGLFRIFQDEAGNEKVVNDLGNVHLQDPLTRPGNRSYGKNSNVRDHIIYKPAAIL